MVAAFCWKLGKAYCGFGEEEDAKPGVLSDPEWEEDELAKEAKMHHENSAKIEQLEGSIQQSLRRQRQERQHRLTVFAKQFDATECPRTSPKTKKELEFLGRVLAEDRSFIFCDFTEQERGFMLDVCRKDDSIKKGDILFSVGDAGDGFFYIIQKGLVDLMQGHSTGGITSKTLGRGDSFGEVALVMDVPRIKTARAKTDCILWKMHQHCFRAKLAYHTLKKEEEMIGQLRRVPLFGDMDDATLRKFANSMELVNFKAGQRILNKGDVGLVFYIVDHGEVRIHGIGAGDSQSIDLIKKAGQYIGERSLLTGEPRHAHATAITEVAAWAVDRETFESSFGPLREMIQHQFKKNMLKAIPIFAESDINASEMNELADKMQEICFKAGHRIDEVGKPRRQELIVIRHGRISVYDGESEGGSKVFTLKNGDYYGDKHIKDEPTKQSSVNVVCEENATVWTLTKADIEDVLKDVHRLGQSVSFQVKRRVSSYSRHIHQKELVRVRVLGHGGFGKVWLVKHKNTGVYYALKELNKRRILEKKQTKNVMREKEILAILNHVFILSEVSSFQDQANCYIVMDLVQGGELYTQIVNTRGKGLPLNDAKFYGACIHCALAHFHARLICYRDLKPENVMIDKRGYCVIVDLGFAKVVTTKTFTLCGTPEYLAPEILMSKGHDKAVDLWSFGVLIYELLTGRSAFYRPGRTQVEMFKCIVRTKYDMPPEADSVSADLIQKLLVRNPSLRLGNLSNGSQDLQDHPWFEAMDWTKLRHMELAAPWVPVIKEGAAVTESHYDASDGAYKEISFGRPLTSEEQSIFRTF